MIATPEMRYWIQVASLVFFVAATGMLAALVITRRLPWRYSVGPGWVLAQLVAFYVYVVIITGPGSHPVLFTTYWSAFIRVQEGAVVLAYLCIIWKWRKPPAE